MPCFCHDVSVMAGWKMLRENSSHCSLFNKIVYIFRSWGIRLLFQPQIQANERLFEAEFIRFLILFMIEVEDSGLRRELNRFESKKKSIHGKGKTV
jgi:hypothetical protein